jgi:hypothetical protein
VTEASYKLGQDELDDYREAFNAYRATIGMESCDLSDAALAHAALADAATLRRDMAADLKRRYSGASEK